MSRRRIHYNVAPRFTSGSPAQVPFDTAMHVADQERGAYDNLVALDPGHVDAQPHRLEGIVEEREERADHWFVTDLLTGKQFIRLFPEHDAKRAARKTLTLKRRFPGVEVRTV